MCVPQVRVSEVYKIFGKQPETALRKLQSGASREDVKNFGTAAVIDASFAVEPGETFVVMGLSGSGKSTLIRMLNGLLKPTSGTVSIDGTDLASASETVIREVRRTKVAMVFQHFALLPHRTVLENAAYALEIRGLPGSERHDRAKHWLGQVGLAGWEEKYPHQLSGGMKQRVGLARALAAETEILLMDEAFSALDPLIRREMQEQLAELQSSLGKTIIFITHDLNEAMFLGDRIAVMRNGQIVQIGTAEAILTDPANDYVAQFVMDVDRTRVLTAASVMEKPRATVPTDAGPRVAMRTMQEAGVSGALVVDRNRRLRGFVTADDVVAAAQAKQADLTGLIRTEGLLSVAADTSLADLFEPSTVSVVPLSVVDEDGRLIGTISRVMLLLAMANKPSATNGDSDEVAKVQ